MITGACELDNCDTGPLYALNQSTGPFKYEASCEYVKKRAWVDLCIYEGGDGCDLRSDALEKIEEANKERQKFNRRMKKSNAIKG